jgi:hypothetical protein
MSTAVTAGFGNPVLATVEAAGASVLSVISVLWPIAAFILVTVLLVVCWFIIYFVGKRVLRLFRQKSPGLAAT